jgi:hypothetical protein
MLAIFTSVGHPWDGPKAVANAEVDRQAQADDKIRNAVEGKFGQGKRRFSPGHVMANLAHSAETAIAITFLGDNAWSAPSRRCHSFLATVTQKITFSASPK